MRLPPPTVSGGDSVPQLWEDEERAPRRLAAEIEIPRDPQSIGVRVCLGCATVGDEAAVDVRLLRRAEAKIVEIPNNVGFVILTP